MEIKDFIKNLVEQFDEVELEALTPETKFKEFDEFSSLTILSIIAMADDEYGVRLKADDVRQAETVQDLFDTVQSRIQG
ncbi:MAG: acyl carrier protein [Bacteroidales bacterium]|jgi:acyl carrier protein|nr:acyl carrier protein [Bacteroidales bacterium]